MDTTENHSLLERIVSFITEAGIACSTAKLGDDTFLPGVDIQNGCIIYDVEKLKYPGDMLHEAGHLAMLLPEHRSLAQSPDNLSGDIHPAAAEMGAIAWSWAAIKQLGILPEVVFHEHGYKGGSKEMIANFNDEKYIAVPLLQWFGMTKEPKRDIAPDEYTYPGMKHWLRPGK